MQTVDQCVLDLKSRYDVIDVIDASNYQSCSTELYGRILANFKEAYADQQRIVLILTKDYYKNDSSCGILLQSLQTIVNDIDISNYFICLVTSNDDIAKEYSWLLKNISSDEVSFHVYQCSGVFQRMSATDQQPYIKYQKLQTFDLVNNLTDREKNFLFESKSFCMMPWVSLMISPNSVVSPCCESSLVLGDCSKSSLKDIWNSSATKKLRKDMLQGKAISSCDACYQKEQLGRDTLRKSINRRFVKQISLVETTDHDGYLDSFDLRYLDARFNNLCNLFCRSCGPNISSSWHEPAVFLQRKDKTSKALFVAGKSDKDVYTQITEHVETLERIYFSGGEPLIIEQFYDLVELLDKKGKHEVELIYNTNMTKTGIKQRSIFDLWKNFKKISIGASLDAELGRGEYLRAGSDWKTIVEFRKQMISQRPDIDFYISATTSIINAWHLPDFHRSWVDQGLIKPEDFNIQMLFDPGYLRVDRAPSYLKTLIKRRYQEHLEWLRPRDKVGRAVYGFESILNFIQADNDFDAKTFWDNITPMDKYQNTDLVTVFPELADLPRS